MTKAEEKAMAYADEKLKAADQKLAESGYQRHTKMRVNIFSGSDVEEAYQEGYEQSEQDHRRASGRGGYGNAGGGNRW